MDFSGLSSSHPPLPPISEEDLFSCLRLLRSRRVGVATYHRLIDEYGTAAAALEALPEVARAAGEARYTICPEGVIHAELKAARRAGAQARVLGRAGYPAQLAEITDAPPILWARGPGDAIAQDQIALVGARNASSLGTRTARKIAGDLGAAGFGIVSGLARGVDTAAHSASLETGTIAVLAGGVDVAYPAENARLLEQVAAQGLVFSEMPMGTQPQARHFPRRNRIISGIARAVVVVEAAAKSGSLITAQIAGDQGREVFAVPGHPFDARAGGCNILIRDGATLIRDATDVIDALARPAPAIRPPCPETPARPHPLHEAAALHRHILDRLGPSPMAEDQLIRESGASPDQVSSLLVDLEINGQIERQTGGLLALKSD